MVPLYLISADRTSSVLDLGSRTTRHRQWLLLCTRSRCLHHQASPVAPRAPPRLVVTLSAISLHHGDSRSLSDITSGSRISPDLIGGLGSLGISQIPSRVSRLSVLFWISSHHQQLLPLDLLVPLVGLGSRSSQSLSGPRSWLSASSSASQLHRLISRCLFRSFSAFLIFSCSRISFGRSS